MATWTKSSGVNVIPILNMSAAKAAVKYSVVNHAKLLGDFKARPVNNTVHTGNKLANRLALVSYASNTFCPNVLLGSGSDVGAIASLCIINDDAFCCCCFIIMEDARVLVDDG